MTDDAKLLRQYAEEDSEAAFGELVERYCNLVYSAALRRVAGDTQLAEDVAQRVFTVLARMARRLPQNVLLGGWLYRHTCFVAAQAVRTEQRRRRREQTAAEMNATNDVLCAKSPACGVLERRPLDFHLRRHIRIRASQSQYE